MIILKQPAYSETSKTTKNLQFYSLVLLINPWDLNSIHNVKTESIF